MDEARLVAEAKKGSHFAYIQLVEHYQKSLYCTALSISGSSWDAFDILQDTLLQAFISLPTLKDPKTFKYWLTRILINKSYDQQRKTKHSYPMEHPPETPYEFHGNEEHLDLFNALNKLEDKYRVILSLRYFQDLPIKEMASILECSQGTVKSRLNYALKELRKVLGYKSFEEVIR